MKRQRRTVKLSREDFTQLTDQPHKTDYHLVKHDWLPLIQPKYEDLLPRNAQ